MLATIWKFSTKWWYFSRGSNFEFEWYLQGATKFLKHIHNQWFVPRSPEVLLGIGLWSLQKKLFWSHNKCLQIQIQSDLSFIWPWCGYVLGSIWWGFSIGSNQNNPWHTNPFFFARKWNFFIFSKMILQVSRKWLPFLLLLGASLESFPTQNFFRATTCIIHVFRTSLWSHSFATK